VVLNADEGAAATTGGVESARRTIGHSEITDVRKVIKSNSIAFSMVASDDGRLALSEGRSD
jgi:hypothetical protein